MALLGDAALAMWWDMAPSMRAEFQDWHTHEHFPERLALPGFQRGSRWRATEGDGFFVLYELAQYDALTSPAYQARLNAPTPWSTKLMPHHSGMVRSQSRVRASHGGVTAAHALTVRLSPTPAAAQAFDDHLRALLAALAQRPGLVGAHLLRTDTPAIAPTTEQKIRGNDRAADWICLITGYDATALRALADGALSAPALQAAGAQPGAVSGLYTLAASMHAAEFRP